jgi:hypothetical protein
LFTNLEGELALTPDFLTLLESAAQSLHDQSEQLGRHDGLPERARVLGVLGAPRAVLRLETAVVVYDWHGLVRTS